LHYCLSRMGSKEIEAFAVPNKYVQPTRARGGGFDRDGVFGGRGG